jgi:hypothetical protein
MREKLFTLSRTQREDIWRRFKQTGDRRVAERLHAIVLLDSCCERFAPPIQASGCSSSSTMLRIITRHRSSKPLRRCEFSYCICRPIRPI